MHRGKEAAGRRTPQWSNRSSPKSDDTIQVNNHHQQQQHAALDCKQDSYGGLSRTPSPPRCLYERRERQWRGVSRADPSSYDPDQDYNPFPEEDEPLEDGVWAEYPDFRKEEYEREQQRLSEEERRWQQEIKNEENRRRWDTEDRYRRWEAEELRRHEEETRRRQEQHRREQERRDRERWEYEQQRKEYERLQRQHQEQQRSRRAAEERRGLPRYPDHADFQPSHDSKYWESAREEGRQEARYYQEISPKDDWVPPYEYYSSEHSERKDPHLCKTAEDSGHSSQRRTPPAYPTKEAPRNIARPSPQPKQVMVEIQPGFSLPLRGSQETLDAVARGRVLNASCMVCCFCVVVKDDCDFVICPECRVVSPVEGGPGTMQYVGLGMAKSVHDANTARYY